MEQFLWNSIDDLYEDLLIPDGEHFEQLQSVAEEKGVPAIAVSKLQGRFLYLIVKMLGAKKILEIGTLAGFSSICMAQGLQEDGKLISLEIDESFAELARLNFEQAGVSHKIDVMNAPALQSLEHLRQQSGEPFDLIFIDADKVNNPHYFNYALKLSKAGTVIIADNVVRQGDILKDNTDDMSVQGIREFNKMIANNDRVEATTLQTVGSKGYDGLMLIRVKV